MNVIENSDNAPVLDDEWLTTNEITSRIKGSNIDIKSTISPIDITNEEEDYERDKF